MRLNRTMGMIDRITNYGLSKPKRTIVIAVLAALFSLVLGKVVKHQLAMSQLESMVVALNNLQPNETALAPWGEALLKTPDGFEAKEVPAVFCTQASHVNASCDGGNFYINLNSSK